jgi:hypothetical protein
MGSAHPRNPNTRQRPHGLPTACRKFESSRDITILAVEARQAPGAFVAIAG